MCVCVCVFASLTKHFHSEEKLLWDAQQIQNRDLFKIRDVRVNHFYLIFYYIRAIGTAYVKSGSVKKKFYFVDHQGHGKKLEWSSINRCYKCSFRLPSKLRTNLYVISHAHDGSVYFALRIKRIYICIIHNDTNNIQWDKCMKIIVELKYELETKGKEPHHTYYKQKVRSAKGRQDIGRGRTNVCRSNFYVCYVETCVLSSNKLFFGSYMMSRLKPTRMWLPML